MTYCVALLLDEGLVFASDTRTNAGVDQVAIFPKMNIFEVPGERVITLLTAGNLAITQAVVNRLREAIKAEDGAHLNNVSSMFEAAQLVGDVMREVFERDAEHLKNHNTDFNASILLGGQIQGEKPRLFNIYAAGNFIESCRETPYFQIGETKYGKPIIDRVVKYNSDMMDAVKCVLISFDSTIRSNISVAAPIDLMLYRVDSLNANCRQRIEEKDPYYATIRQGWSEGLKSVFSGLPSPDWC
ncbi:MULTISPECIES: proteasome-type protease [Methylovorus]|jgi:putative proteasome-type protease|uniref:20S proteasome A and B subunits n=1 Tax=Methylovorus glucosotrophus (strain SIP3-4) TaxID=582744 RepID=C6XA04_METGS|nr:MULTISPECIES: proteasome-type protease [Methylovorus]ACT51545.1 20S proteasome A and B subunits [Methylovorus glucosotrophus SIP3-4]ADQ85407.1 20S proteasome A and B subunits [Methylovorus sp. MP688]KAF0843196.1 putative proteasome-type protease [Methylovorus glucosotrophus]